MIKLKLRLESVSFYKNLVLGYLSRWCFIGFRA